jgi:DNA-binding IclR family transcriptional regulator
LLDVVAGVRSLGFAVDDQEYTPGLRCVAVPVYDIDNQVIAALSASIPLMRAHDELFEAALRQISLASIAISRALGSHDDDPRLAELTEWRGNVFAAAHD